MPVENPGVEFRPTGERIARVETLMESIREDVTEIRAQLETLTTQHAKQDAYARIGRTMGGVMERVVLVLLGSGAAMWMQRHWGN